MLRCCVPHRLLNCIILIDQCEKSCDRIRVHSDLQFLQRRIFKSFDRIVFTLRQTQDYHLTGIRMGRLMRSNEMNGGCSHHRKSTASQHYANIMLDFRGVETAHWPGSSPSFPPLFLADMQAQKQTHGTRMNARTHGHSRI